MKVQYVFGPNAGQQFHAPRDQFIDILIKSGVLELIEDTPVRRGHMDNAASQAIRPVNQVYQVGHGNQPEDGGGPGERAQINNPVNQWNFKQVNAET